MEFSQFVGFIKRNKLQTESFFVGQNQCELFCYYKYIPDITIIYHTYFLSTSLACCLGSAVDLKFIDALVLVSTCGLLQSFSRLAKFLSY